MTDHNFRRLLESLPAAAPPDDFADRVVGSIRERNRSRALWPVFAAAAVGAATVAGLALWPKSPGLVIGSQSATERTTVSLGPSALAVLEPGSELSWQRRGDSYRVEQAAGRIFYRVDEPTTFVVATHHGDVEVTGTCFELEIPMNVKKHLASAAAGAVLVVAVYEGSVLFRKGGDAKASVEVPAGQELVVGSEDAKLRDRSTPNSDIDVAAADLGAPAGTESREQLLARDSAQRAEIAALRKKLRAVDQRGRARKDDDGELWYRPSQEALLRFAKECRVRYDIPPVLGATPEQLPAKMATELGLSELERTAVNDLLRAVHAEFNALVRALYIEVTGDASRADDLSPKAMISDLRDKSPAGESDRVQRRIARERAGLAVPPDDLSETSALERYYRALAGLGDESEKRLGEVLGPAKAKKLREANGGFGTHLEISGCGDEADVEEN